ncbi:N-acetylmuramoyl-L-alanine amidase [Streptomyces sp. H27-H1]|uniref:peptidoglycan recognition protein family protein n=1 Tax=Streptomyces sp. H27-H1 TaxID=2996461 RepID=UPI00226FBC6A|nr:N-acetylmuramoyl-L-alanine amidase [Streptomyces sp. H27-H1]MCY0928295.1 N-acetylmuramoyl-L-alanine amidase [Streptomyces sp. H27-H1]
MAWYAGATRMELQPESDSQPAIVPTQFILHSIAAPWTKERVFEYWRDSTNLDSHFGQSFDGSIAQYIGTQTRADANYLANKRADGTGAVSIETASNSNHSDPWTAEQVEGLIRLGVWLHQQHGIPLRICRTASDPGFGYHRLHSDWAVSGTACPGDARVAQFRTIVFPGIVARANGQTAPTEEPDMDANQAKQLAEIHRANVPYMGWSYRGDGADRDAYGDLRTAVASAGAADAKAAQILQKLATAQPVALTPEQVAAIADKLAASPALAEQIAEKVAAKLATRLQS